MKVFLNVMGIIFSIIVTIVLFILEIGLGITSSAGKFLTKESISNSITEIEITEMLEDKEGKTTELGTQVYDSLEQAGLTKEQTKKLLSNSKLKKVFGDYVGSVIVNKINPDEEISYPSKQSIVELVEENYDVLATSLELKSELNDETRNQIKELIDENYEDIIKSLKDISKGMGDI